jgi:hypothetical protein
MVKLNPTNHWDESKNDIPCGGNPRLKGHPTLGYSKKWHCPCPAPFPLKKGELPPASYIRKTKSESAIYRLLHPKEFPTGVPAVQGTPTGYVETTRAAIPKGHVIAALREKLAALKREKIKALAKKNKKKTTP